MIPPVYSWLNVPAVTALVGNRIYAHGDAGESPTYPYITWQQVSGAPSNYLDRNPTVDNPRIQFDVWSRDQAQVVTVATAVRNAIDPNGHEIVRIGPSRDPETRSYRLQMDYSIWNYR